MINQTVTVCCILKAKTKMSLPAMVNKKVSNKIQQFICIQYTEYSEILYLNVRY